MMDLFKRKRRNPDLKKIGLMGAIPLGLVATGALGYYIFRRKERWSYPSPIHLKSSVNIDREAREIYNFWRSFVQLPRVMTFLDRVEDRGGDLTHWIVAGPKGSTLEWDSEVVEDLPGERLSWKSLPGSEVQTWGSVQFQDNSQDRGTDVIVDLNFEPSGVITGPAVGHFLKRIEKTLLNQNLRNLKVYMETGEVPTNKRQNFTRPEARLNL